MQVGRVLARIADHKITRLDELLLWRCAAEVAQQAAPEQRQSATLTKKVSGNRGDIHKTKTSLFELSSLMGGALRKNFASVSVTW